MVCLRTKFGYDYQIVDKSITIQKGIYNFDHIWELQMVTMLE